MASFIDQVQVYVQSGNGGKGCVSFRREKFIPKGGPNGGDGGRGGDVVLQAERGPTTLAEHRYRKRYVAKNGTGGMGNQCTGASADRLIIQVPIGTMVFDDETGEQIADLVEHGQQWVAATGGQGGLGNQHFASSTRQAPRYAQPGIPGESRWIRLELKLLADVGLVGLPNAGKSTLISRISAARPKVADYPFTTLVPNLGVVNWGDFESFVVADIPGLIKGAHEGKGLGTQFLRHVERSRCLLFMCEVTGMAEPPEQALSVLWAELEAHNPELLTRPYMLAATKCDATDPDCLDQARTWADDHKVPLFEISAVTGDGLEKLVHHMGNLVARAKAADDGADGPNQTEPGYRDIWGDDP